MQISRITFVVFVTSSRRRILVSNFLLRDVAFVRYDDVFFWSQTRPLLISAFRISDLIFLFVCQVYINDFKYIYQPQVSTCMQIPAVMWRLMITQAYMIADRYIYTQYINACTAKE